MSEQGIAPNPDKMLGLRNASPPTSLREVRGFLGLTNYFRRFIKDFANIARPITQLTKNGAAVWTAEHGIAFEMLKEKLVTAPKLAHYKQDVPTFVSCDASNYAMGAVLELVIVGELRPVGYWSLQIKGVEFNYITFEKEAMAMVRALRFWRYELVGTQFTVFTDNAAFSTVLTQRLPGARILRWVCLL
mmetsp:Transcript_8713/g.21710  ORF Transcript_8713/g.21710 Transcript_8713/m.21710 type:complete len:189 (+) Transcript_8713:537-1103(+)